MSEYLFIELLGFDEYLFIPKLVFWLGFINILLAVVAGLLFLLRRFNRYLFSNKNELLKKALKPLSKVHPFIGVGLLIVAFVHGDLTSVSNVFRVHTGPLIWWIILLMMLVAIIGRKFRVKNWLKVHRGLAVLMVVSVMLHLFARNLLG